jgi:hypothetical protein
VYDTAPFLFKNIQKKIFHAHVYNSAIFISLEIKRYMPMIFDLIVQAKARNADATMKLIKQFNPLLKKYAYKLYYEDSYNDLLVDFIELIQNIQFEYVYNRDEGS